MSNLCSSWFGNILLQDHECQKCKFRYHKGIVPDNLKNPLMSYLIKICFDSLICHNLYLFHARFIYKFIGKTYTYLPMLDEFIRCATEPLQPQIAAMRITMKRQSFILISVIFITFSFKLYWTFLVMFLVFIVVHKIMENVCIFIHYF